jgi:acetoacetyl-[acyl-carrier protein] synthase
MLAVRHAGDYADYTTRREQTRANAAAYADRADGAELDVIYRFGESLINESEVSLTERGIKIPGFAQPVEFNLQNPFADMQETSLADQE